MAPDANAMSTCHSHQVACQLRANATAMIASALHPAARLGGLGGQQPVEQDSVGDRAAEAAHNGRRGHERVQRRGLR
jgi:hypothetical protein